MLFYRAVRRELKGSFSSDDGDGRENVTTLLKDFACFQISSRLFQLA